MHVVPTYCSSSTAAMHTVSEPEMLTKPMSRVKGPVWDGLVNSPCNSITSVLHSLLTKSALWSPAQTAAAQASHSVAWTAKSPIKLIIAWSKVPKPKREAEARTPHLPPATDCSATRQKSPTSPSFAPVSLNSAATRSSGEEATPRCS